MLKPADGAEPAERVDAVLSAAQESGPARAVWGPSRTLYTRVVATRKLLHVWEQLGNYLEPAKRRLSRAVDGPELSRLFQEMTVLLRRFPRLMGAAGQPGYLVLVLSQQEEMARSFQALDPGQREALSRDWATGQKLLAAHRDFLRQEIRATAQTHRQGAHDARGVRRRRRSAGHAVHSPAAAGFQHRPLARLRHADLGAASGEMRICSWRPSRSVFGGMYVPGRGKPFG